MPTRHERGPHHAGILPRVHGPLYDFGMRHLELRRLAPRIAIDGLCGIVTGHDLRPATVTDLSWLGLRVEVPVDHTAAPRTVQLEIELPEIDEIVWARGHVTFAHLAPMGGFHADGQPRLWCRAGIAIEGVAARERRLMHEYVIETTRANV